MGYEERFVRLGCGMTAKQAMWVLAWSTLIVPSGLHRPGTNTGYSIGRRATSTTKSLISSPDAISSSSRDSSLSI